ncbi:glycoside hydrolase family 28 protein [Treponema sp. OttesenSCG-928-L16]|nr:glycoside hydrolase family 28 protein [Treponema sp. OttesenSCG-928-L16]
MQDFNIDNFGGKGDGSADNSSAFSAAFAAIREAGGGVLHVGPGIWATGPIELFSRTALSIDEKALISFIPEPERYIPVFSRWEGVECYAMHPCVFASQAEDVVITGKGRLEGNGQVWWDMLKEKRRRWQAAPETAVELELARLNGDYRSQPGGGGGREIQFLRPPLIQFFNCRNCRIENISAVNSPFWTVHPVYCDGLVLSKVSITNPHEAPNTDGIDIDSCSNVLIEGCCVSVGDDGIAIKSGSGPDGIRVNRPSSNVTVRRCVVADGHGGIVIGSETAGGIDTVLAEDCVFKGTDRGIRIKTRRGRGGHIRNLVFRNLVMENNLCPLSVNMFYRCGADREPELFSLDALPRNSATPRIENIEVSHISARQCRASAGFIAGLPESPVEGLRIADSEFSTDEKSNISPNASDMFLGLPEVKEKSFRVINAGNPEFTNVSITGPEKPFIFY